MHLLGRKRALLTLLFTCFLIAACHTNSYAKVIYTNNTKIDAAAAKVIRRCTTKKMNRKAKLKAVYTYLVKNMHYSHSRGPVRIKVSAKDVKLMKAEKKKQTKKKNIRYSSAFKRRYQNLLTMQGTCYDMSAVFCILANHLGYPAGLNSGRYVRNNGSTCEHWWNHVVISGKTKYFDIQAANCSWKSRHSMSGILTYYCKDKGSRAWRKHHR